MSRRVSAWPAALLATWLCGAQAVPLGEFVREVVDSNPLVREQVHAYRQVAQDYEIALSGWRPSLDLAASYGQFRRRAPNTGQRRLEFDSAQADVTLSQNLFSGFDTSNQIDQARARITAAAYRLYDTADNVALDAVQAYLAVLTQHRLVELAAQNVESHERILGKIRELSEKGITRRSDLEQTEGRLARAQASLIAQQNNLEDALTELHKLLGRYLSPSELEEPTQMAALDDVTIEGLIEEALRIHPAIESARSNVQAARFEYRRSKRSDYPTLDLELRQSVGNDVDAALGRTEEGSAVLSLRYNLYRGGADVAEQRKRISALHENKAFLDRVRRQVMDTLRLAWAADRALGGQLPFLSRHAEKSLETVELYRQEYLLQKRDLIDVLDAESELNRALIARAEARYASMTARYRIFEGLGALFDALELDVALGDGELRISGHRPAGVDIATLADDSDADGKPDDVDQCDASLQPRDVDAFGCEQQVQVELGFDAVDLTFEAVDDTVELEAGRSIVLTAPALLENDKMSARDEPAIRAFTQPENGAVIVDDDGHFRYQPNSGFVGKDRFTYTVGDSRGRRSTAQVQLVVAKAASAGRLVRYLHFAYKQLELTPESLRHFEDAVAELRSRPTLHAEVRAYTDNVGSRAYNRRLSQQRAEALRRMLVERGIDPARVEAVGMGERDPIGDNNTDAGRALNRRAELRLRDPTGS